MLAYMTKERSGIPLNEAIAAVLTDRKKELGLSYDDLVRSTGLPSRTLYRIFLDERPIDTRQLEIVSGALQISQSKIVADALARLEKHDGI